MDEINNVLQKYEYPGRGIVVGINDDTKFFLAYFITGRSLNSKNRILELDSQNNLKTKPFKKEQLKNENLTIYTAMTKFKDIVIISNGNHTDTILKGLKNKESFEKSLKETTFEPDAPIFTPRISAVLYINEKKYAFSIIKSGDEKAKSTNRIFFEFENILKGSGHLIHTYKPKNNIITNSFYGEPTIVKIPQTLEQFTNSIWESLNEKNKISLFTMSINKETKEEQIKIINKKNNKVF